MSFLLIVLLAGAVIVALVKLAGHRRAVGRLEQAIVQKRPWLREEVPVASGAAWDRLCSAANELIAEADRLQQQQSGHLTQLEATLGNLQEAVLMVDTNNRILLANNAFRDVFPGAATVLGQRLEVILRSVSFLNYVTAVRVSEAEPRQEIEFQRGEESKWLEVTGSVIPPLDGGEGQWALFVLHDITRQKKLERMRKDFVANVSHELRTPLSVIKGYVETLVDGRDAVPASDQERFLKTIQRHTERLNSLVEDLLTLSRLESVTPGLSREAVVLPDFIKAVADDHQPQFAASDHALRYEVDSGIGKLSFDPARIGQVFENLLANAVKYTPRGTQLEILARLQESEVVIAVKDDGPGIPAVDVPHVFERFYRVDKGRARDKGGTGLGLSIVKHIVQLHGGRVWVESVVGQGTTFYFTLPVRAAVE